MVSLNTISLILGSAASVLAAVPYSNSTDATCTSVVTSLVAPEPTLCACPGDDSVQALIDAEKDSQQSVQEILDIMQLAHINTTQIENLLSSLHDDVAGLANIVNGAACVGPPIVSVISNIVESITEVVTTISGLAGANAALTSAQIMSLIASIGEAVGSVIKAIKFVIDNEEVLACFGCQDINALNNMISTLQSIGRKVIPTFPRLPLIPTCSAPTTSLITVTTACAAPTPDAALVARQADACYQTYTVSASAPAPSLCPCTPNDNLNGVITNIGNVVSFIKSVLSKLPALPGLLGTLTTQILPTIVDDLVRIMNLITGTGCIASFAGPLITTLKSLITSITQAIQLLQGAGSDAGAVVSVVITSVGSILNVANSLIHQIYAVVTDESLECFACADLATLNNLIVQANNELSKIPALNGTLLTTFPGCSTAAVVTSVVPCA